MVCPRYRPDPGLKRFISSDPIGMNGGLNIYAYVLNSPIRYIDPYGHSWWAAAEAVATAACTVYSVAAGMSNYKADKYDDSVQQSDIEASKINDSLNDQDVRRCIEQFQVHKDECLRDKCLKEAMQQRKERMDQQQKKYEDARQDNPYPRLPQPDVCDLYLKPKPKR